LATSFGQMEDVWKKVKFSSGKLKILKRQDLQVKL
jgi:hypothetical protein